MPVWLQCNLDYPGPCARAHLALTHLASLAARRMFLFICACMSVYVCVHDHAGTTGSGAQVSRGMVPGPWACLLS